MNSGRCGNRLSGRRIKNQKLQVGHFGVGTYSLAQDRLCLASLARRKDRFCGYPRIAWVIPCHQEGFCRHMYTARLWPTINNGSA